MVFGVKQQAANVARLTLETHDVGILFRGGLVSKVAVATGR